jgi:hypothetical protein
MLPLPVGPVTTTSPVHSTGRSQHPHLQHRVLLPQPPTLGLDSPLNRSSAQSPVTVRHSASGFFSGGFLGLPQVVVSLTQQQRRRQSGLSAERAGLASREGVVLSGTQRPDPPSEPWPPLEWPWALPSPPPPDLPRQDPQVGNPRFLPRPSGSDPHRVVNPSGLPPQGQRTDPGPRTGIQAVQAVTRHYWRIPCWKVKLRECFAEQGRDDGKDSYLSLDFDEGGLTYDANRDVAEWRWIRGAPGTLYGTAPEVPMRDFPSARPWLLHATIFWDRSPREVHFRRHQMARTVFEDWKQRFWIMELQFEVETPRIWRIAPPHRQALEELLQGLYGAHVDAVLNLPPGSSGRVLREMGVSLDSSTLFPGLHMSWW